MLMFIAVGSKNESISYLQYAIHIPLSHCLKYQYDALLIHPNSNNKCRDMSGFAQCIDGFSSAKRIKS